MLRPAGIGAEHAQAADQHRHLGSRQPQQLRAVDQRFFRRHELHACLRDVVAEAIGARLERRKGSTSVCSCEASMRPGVNGNLDVDAGVLRGLLDRGSSRRERSGRPARPSCRLGRLVEIVLDRFELLEHFRELGRLVHLPVLLRAEADARAVGAAALVRAAERRGRRPGGRNQLRHRQTRARIFAFSAATSLSLTSV